VRPLAAEACRLRALVPLRRLLDEGAADAALDEELAFTSFSFGFTELGARFAERAATALGTAGDGRRASDVLRAAEEYVAAAGSTTFERLAAAHARLGAPAESARLLVSAAVCARAEGALLRAVELCWRASELAPGVAGLHREWGLALLAAGDAVGARGHFERWREQRPDCLEAAFWARECSLRSLQSASVSLHSEQGRAGGPAIERAPVRAGSDATRRVLVLGDALRCIAEIEAGLARWNVELSILPTAQPDVTAAREPFDLVVVALPASAELARLRLDWLRCMPAFAGVPFLGAVRLERVTLARTALRDLGVVGLLDCSAKRDEVAFRLVQALGLESSADRARVRVPVDFPVELESEGRVTQAHAENLSRSGIRLRDARALAPNELVFVRFLLGMESVALEGRVIHCHPAADGCGGHVIGIFFFSIEPRPRQLLEAEIDALLAARCADDGPRSSSGAAR
jgi:hypothetical protein